MTYETLDYRMNKTLVETNVEEIKKQIEESRQELYNLINITDNFADQKVIMQSQRLDELLNDYEEIKFNKNI